MREPTVVDRTKTRPDGSQPPSGYGVPGRPSFHQVDDDRSESPNRVPLPPDTRAAQVGGDDGLVRLTVDLTTSAYDSLEEAVKATGDNRTDTVNRALLIYAHVQRLADAGGGTVTLSTKDGKKTRLTVQ